MKKVREIMRLYEESSLSRRKIARALTLSRPVVSDYIRKLSSSGLNYADIREMPDDALLEILSAGKGKDRARYEPLRKNFKHYAVELTRVGVTRQILWEEYKQEHPDGYSYGQFCYHFQVWNELREVSMHCEHTAGDKAFVDFTGKKLTLTDRETGEKRAVEVFVGLLGASQLTYVEAAMSQKKEDWIRVNANMLDYFGGVPRAIVPDCLKSAITKGDTYEPDINPEYLDFARHYNTTILPARPYKPKDKALVEGAVRIVYSWIFARIRNEIFFSLTELNTAIREKLEEYNAKPLQRLDISRKELFNEVESAELLPLPSAAYEQRKFERRRVQFNYHVYLKDDKHYYSVPYRYKGEHVDIFYTDSTVEIYHNNVRIALYRRIRSLNGYTTTPEHMPPNHRYKENWDPEKLTRWAAGIGEDVARVIERVLTSKIHPEQAYKTCLGILNLKKRYTGKRLNKACACALYYDRCSYRMIKNILENGREDVVNEQDASNHTLPYHENIRGKDYYREGNA